MQENLFAGAPFQEIAAISKSGALDDSGREMTFLPTEEGHWGEPLHLKRMGDPYDSKFLVGRPIEIPENLDDVEIQTQSGSGIQRMLGGQTFMQEPLAKINLLEQTIVDLDGKPLTFPDESGVASKASDFLVKALKMKPWQYV